MHIIAKLYRSEENCHEIDLKDRKICEIPGAIIFEGECFIYRTLTYNDGKKTNAKYQSTTTLKVEQAQSPFAFETVKEYEDI